MIKNLLFDLGGVIMDIRKENCVAAFTKLGLKDAAQYFGDFSQKGPFYGIERGDITPAEFHRIMHELLPTGVSDEDIDFAFCQFLIGIPEYRLRLLDELRKTHKVYLLSNTNPIMWRLKIRDEFEKLGKTREDYFDGIITSFEAHSMKPQPEIFEFTIQQLGIYPEETMFFDDSQANLDAAAKFSFHTALVPHGTDIVEVIKSQSL